MLEKHAFAEQGKFTCSRVPSSLVKPHVDGNDAFILFPQELHMHCASALFASFINA
jgi:hypothetical protein